MSREYRRMPLHVGKKSMEWIVEDADESSKLYISNFTTQYFEYLLEVHEAGLKEETQKYQAATALRQLYMQVLETTMAFFSAVIQAPRCVPMWMQKYLNSDLNWVVKSLLDGHVLPGHLAPVDLQELADHFSDRFGIMSAEGIVTQNSDWEQIAQLIRANIPKALKYLMADLLSEDLTNEYNSIKHGLRITAGSSALVFRIEGRPTSLTLNSDFSSSFPVIQELNKANKQFELNGVTLGFDPEHTIQRIMTCIRVLRHLRFQFLLNLHGEAEIELDVPLEEEIIRGWEMSSPITQLTRMSDNF